ncbi:hypothetical protein SAMN05444363_1210 [Flavobacterium terrae]|uniref:Uncharacterized protein n=1 Tax=Flavobacterium terrae TaxID=415425 RepID=A0A1M6D2D9_9FLAO|nr:hypothetical protein SAMN05444363_1210 [Flavobacterium terrae]
MKPPSLLFLIVNYFYVAVSILLLFFISTFNLGAPCSLYSELIEPPFIYFWGLLFSNLILVIVLVIALKIFYRLLKIEESRISKYFKINLKILLLFDFIFISIKLIQLIRFAEIYC